MDVKQAEQAVSSHPVGSSSHANGHAEQARPVRLNGSCHCGECSYNCETRLPYPFMVCHCVACRKAGGTACVNLAADRHSLTVKNMTGIQSYRADGVIATERFFCRRCGSMLWGEDRRYPARIYPFASSLDSEIPKAPEEHHVMTRYRPSWLRLPTEYADTHVEVYPEMGKSRSTWHRVHNLYIQQTVMQNTVSH